ncbi:26S protease regulatory subunit 7 [Pyrus ussuriensis x Pyrus communis]|uniref:26S protease regulatory subunit 7 n=1 Tax=Pyrus ussuriensis x Pyrus communis TaxID=2448454 RepID=A0A5N5G858_9ROSA|nr:26S protease regulatory subunit 7 [Pyrus ussuriensis x Pyrus communis]
MGHSETDFVNAKLESWRKEIWNCDLLFLSKKNGSGALVSESQPNGEQRRSCEREFEKMVEYAIQTGHFPRNSVEWTSTVPNPNFYSSLYFLCLNSPMAPEPEDIKDEKNPRPLDEDDIVIMKTYGLGPYSKHIKQAEKEVKDLAKKVNDLRGIKESDTGLAAPSQYDLVSDKQMMQEEQPLQVARCTKIINPNSEDAKYVINVKQIAKFVVGLGDKVSPTDIEEGMRVGVDRNKYQIQIPLPPKIDPSVTMMTVEEKPDVTYNDVGGCKEQIEKMREVVELPMLHPEKFVKLGIDPPKGVLCYGPPGTGKTLLARAVANRTDACFIRVIGSELVQKYVGEGARMVRELFQMARSKKACIVFFDEVDAIGGARFDDGVGGDNEVQRTMLEIVNQLDGFDARGNIKVLMATNRPDTLDPALLRPGRLDRKVEFGLPDLESRTQIFKIHTRTMNCERDIRFELLARLCPNSTGADIRSVCTEAGMYAIRARRKTATEKDFLDAVNKVIKGQLHLQLFQVVVMVDVYIYCVEAAYANYNDPVWFVFEVYLLEFWNSQQNADGMPEEGEDGVKPPRPLCPGQNTCFNGRDKGLGFLVRS